MEECASHHIPKKILPSVRHKSIGRQLDEYFRERQRYLKRISVQVWSDRQTPRALKDRGNILKNGTQIQGPGLVQALVLAQGQLIGRSGGPSPSVSAEFVRGAPRGSTCPS